MRKLLAISLAGVIGLLPFAARAEDAPQKSERAMTPDSAKSGQSPGEKSERGMNKDAAKPGSSPGGKSERGMDPATSEK